MSKQKVLLVTPFYKPNVGGVETRLYELVRSLNKRNIPVDVLTFQPLITKGVKGASIEIDNKTRIIRHDWFGGDIFHKFLNYPAVVFLYLVPIQIINLLKYFFVHYEKHENFVVHAAGLNSAAACAFLKPFFKYRLVVSTHALYNFKSLLFSKITSLVLNSCDHIFAIGEESKKELAKAGVNAKKISVLPTWVNQDVFKPMNKNEIRHQHGLDGFFIVGYVGRTNENKGMKILLEVAKKLQNQKEIKFFIAGPGDCSEMIKEYSKNQKNLIYIDTIDNYQVPEYLNLMDIFITLPNYSEGYTRSVVESINCGIPVIATDMGCMHEIVTDEVGVLVKSDIDVIVNTLLNLKGNVKKLKEMSENCYVRSRKVYSENGVEKMIKVYFEN